MRKEYIALCVILLELVGCDQSSSVITIPGEGDTSSSSAKYQCKNGYAVSVTYLNNDSNSVVILDMPDKQKMLLVDVVSASGSKYVGGEIEWWVNGWAALLSRFFGENMTEFQEIK